MILRQDDARSASTFHEGLGISLAAPFVGLVVEDGPTLCGALAFNGYDKTSVDMSVIVLRPWSRGVMRAIAEYVFVRLKCKRVSCMTLATNDKAVNRLLTLGFEVEGRLKERFPQGDALIFGLLASRQKILRLPVEQSPSS